MSKDCFAQETLEAYASSQLDGTQVEQIESHLQGCESCCVLLSQIADRVAANDDLPDSSHMAGVQRESVQTDRQVAGTSSLSGNPAYQFWSRQAVDEELGQVPMLIGRYRIEKLLGSGGFGKVYRAFDAELDRKIAIKLPHAKTAALEKQVALIQVEAKIIASLDHPYIVPIYDVGSTDKYPVYLVIKLIDGPNLATYLEESVSPTQAVAWTIQFADALAYAHSKGVTHRDVKPHNILIDSNGQARLTDFGLAWRPAQDPFDYPNAGTPAYMSPEQLRQGQSVDHRTDVYSLGRVLIEMLAPTSSKTISPVINEGSRGGSDKTGRSQTAVGLSSSQNVKTSEELMSICQRAVAERVQDRFGSASEFAESLRRYAAAQGWSNMSQSPAASNSADIVAPLPARATVAGRRLLAAAALAAIVFFGISNWQKSPALRLEATNFQLYLTAEPGELSLRRADLGKLTDSGRRRLAQAADSTDSDIGFELG